MKIVLTLKEVLASVKLSTLVLKTMNVSDNGTPCKLAELQEIGLVAFVAKYPKNNVSATETEIILDIPEEFVLDHCEVLQRHIAIIGSLVKMMQGAMELAMGLFDLVAKDFKPLEKKYNDMFKTPKGPEPAAPEAQ